MRVGRKAHATLSTNSKIYNYTQAAHDCLPLLQAHTYHLFHYPANRRLQQSGKSRHPSCFPCRVAHLLKQLRVFFFRKRNSLSLRDAGPGPATPLTYCSSWQVIQSPEPLAFSHRKMVRPVLNLPTLVQLLI